MTRLDVGMTRPGRMSACKNDRDQEDKSADGGASWTQRFIEPPSSQQL
jgi:hypothetical protein